MQDIVFINERGMLTLPSRIRKELGLTGGQQLIVATTPEGELRLRPSISVPIEMYTEERIAEFSSQEAEIGRLLDQRGAKS
jgi:AbrB family looped-hinge helix DNA binding protein